MFLYAYFRNVDEVVPNVIGQFIPDENSVRFYLPLLPDQPKYASNRELAAVRPTAQRAISAANPRGVLIKTHNIYGMHLGTPAIDRRATAAAIYVVRNPLDVAVSYASFRNKSKDTAVDWVLEQGRILPRAPNGSYMIGGSWVENVTSWRKQRHFATCFVRYEDLLESPMETFGKIVSFVAGKVDEAALEKAIKVTSFDALRAAEDRVGYAGKPAAAKNFFRSGKAGEGLETLTPDQIRRIVEVCGPLMTELGYDLPDV